MPSLARPTRIENRLELVGDACDVEVLLCVPAPPTAELLPQAGVREEARRTGDEAGLVARIDEDSAAASLDDVGREVVGRDCCEERTPRTEVAEDLRGNRERSGVRLEQGEQDVTACHHVRQDGVRLEGKQAKVEQALLLAPAAKPVCP